MSKPVQDYKPPKKSRAQEEFEKHLVAYFDEKLLNVVLQIRAICIAAGISPEKFWQSFVDDKAQDDFYVKLHVEQDKFNRKQQEIINAEKVKEKVKELQNVQAIQNGINQSVEK